jgi:hypothetical protein
MVRKYKIQDTEHTKYCKSVTTILSSARMLSTSMSNWQYEYVDCGFIPATCMYLENESQIIVRKAKYFHVLNLNSGYIVV